MGVMFVSEGKKMVIDKAEFCRYIGNLWKIARETKLENEKIDSEIDKEEESPE